MWIMAPILQDLGWQPYDIQWEYQVGQSKGRVDAALMGEKGAAAFIEAKAPGSRLGQYVEQVLGYAFQEGANICALTTGLEWWLYLPAETDYNFDERRFAELRLKDDPVEQLATDFAAFLGREPLLDGEAEKKAKQVLKARREAEHLDKEVPGVWREMLAVPDEELIELVSKRVYEKTNLRPTPQQVTSALKGSLPPPSDGSYRSVDSSSKGGKQSTGTTKPTAIKLWDNHYQVKSWIGILDIVVDSLYERHGQNFEPALNLRTKRGPYVSRISSDIARPRRVGNRELFLDRNIDHLTIKGRARELLEVFGYKSSDLEITV